MPAMRYRQVEVDGTAKQLAWPVMQHENVNHPLVDRKISPHRNRNRCIDPAKRAQINPRAYGKKHRKCDQLWAALTCKNQQRRAPIARQLLRRADWIALGGFLRRDHYFIVDFFHFSFPFSFPRCAQSFVHRGSADLDMAATGCARKFRIVFGYRSSNGAKILDVTQFGLKRCAHRIPRRQICFGHGVEGQPKRDVAASVTSAFQKSNTRLCKRTKSCPASTICFSKSSSWADQRRSFLSAAPAAISGASAERIAMIERNTVTSNRPCLSISKEGSNSSPPSASKSRTTWLPPWRTATNPACCRRLIASRTAPRFTLAHR